METYKTSNINLAAYLITKGIELLSTDLSNPENVTWTFGDSKECEKLANLYLTGLGLVDARTLFIGHSKLGRQVRGAKYRISENGNYGKYSYR